MRRGGCRDGEAARAVEGVDEALRPAPVLVFNVSREGRWEDGAGDWPREDAIDGRGEERVDIFVICAGL